MQVFPGKEGKGQMSTRGGTRPLWSRDGKAFDVSPDGKRFLIITPAGQDSAASMTMLVNWPAAIRR